MNLTERLNAAAAQRDRKNQGAPVPAAGASAGAFGGSGGAWGAWPNSARSMAWGRSYDPLRAAGNPLENSLLFSALDWQATAFQEAPFCVKRRKDDGTEIIVDGHPMAKLLKRPNPHWSRSRFWRATLVSRFLSGNAYWFKVRSAAGIVRELWWMPHWAVRPMAGSNGLLSHYEYSARGQVYHLEIEDVVHIRYGVDPDNPLSGFAPFRAVIGPVATDRQADDYEGIVMHNMGIPGVVISPKDDNSEIDQADGDKIMATWVARTSGNERGKPIVLPVPVDLQFPALNPSEFDLAHVHDHVESRVAMVTKIPPVVLGALVGLKHSSAKASYRDSERIAWKANVSPTQEEFTEEIDTQLLPDYGMGNPDNEWSAFDRSEVEALQEDRNLLHKRVQDDYKNGICNRAEARGKTGYKVRPEDEDVWAPPPRAAADDAPEKPREDAEQQD